MMLVYFLNSIRSSGAVQRLSEKGLLDADAIIKTDEASLASLIYPVCPRSTWYFQSLGYNL